MANVQNNKNQQQDKSGAKVSGTNANKDQQQHAQGGKQQAPGSQQDKARQQSSKQQG